MRPTMRDDLTWLVQRPLLERTRLIATAYPRFRHGPVRPDLNLRDDLELPPLHNPRTLQWADDLRNRPDLRGADATTLANRVLQHIRSGEFSYTLSPGTYGDTDPRAIVDEFWLDRKAGFCEHFAAAFVVVMRALDIPARIVTGYQGADPLVIDGYHVVRQSHAHAWAEYWQGGIGWVRADPTAAVAPDRIQSSRYLLPRRGLVAGAINTLNPNLLGQLRSGWEAVNNRWNQWVLNYSRGTQFDILKKAGLKSPSWEDLALLLIACLSTLAFAGAAWAWWDRRRQDPWTRLNVRVRSALAACGLAAPAHASLRELAARVRERDGGAQLAAWLTALDGARFGRDATKRPPAGWRIELARHLHALRTR
jgi:transglutaminase-like putative cysteine protease